MSKQPRLFPLFLPIFLELLFVMLTGMVDTLMLATEGDHAVGAVGTANTYIGLFLIMFAVISSGIMAVMTQFIGAKRPGVAQQALRLGLVFNLILGLAISALLFFGGEAILQMVGIARDLLAPARIYLQVVGLFAVCNALTPIFSCYLRAFNQPKAPLIGTVIANLLNVALNALFLFVMDMGVFGVALATGISHLVNLLWVWGASRRITKTADPQPLPNGLIMKKIIQVGLPGAMENILYNLAITIVISLLNRMDTTGMQATARAYMVQIANFSLCTGASLAQANAILVGWRIGACELDACDRETRRTALVGIGIGLIVSSFFALGSNSILPILTRDPEMIRLVRVLLFIDILLEVGRTTNLTFGYALKTSGDATYPMIIAVTFVFLIAAGGTWFFGIKLGMLVVGAGIALALDECVRAVFMFLRWHSGRWKNKNLLNNQ